MFFGLGLAGPVPAQLVADIQSLGFEDNLHLCFPGQGSRCSPPRPNSPEMVTAP